MFLSGCSLNNCKVNPALTIMLEKPNRKNYNVDLLKIMDDPLYNVSMMGSCDFE